MNFIKTIAKATAASILTVAILGFKVPDETPLEYGRFSNEVIFQFKSEVQEKFGFIGNATGGSMPHDIEDLTVGFLAYQKATIEEAREIEIALTEKFLEIINAHEKIRPFLREYPFPSNRVCIKVSFYDKENFPQTKNSISTAYLIKNNIYYDVYTPKDCSFKDIRKESYEEAYQKVHENLTESSF